MKISTVTMADLNQVVEIERQGFSPEEAGSPEAFHQRIEKIPDTFLVARDTEDHVLGFIVGPALADEYVYDWMFADTPTNLPEGGHQLILSLAVSPEAQGKHVGSDLLAALEQVAKKAKRTTMSLTCLDRLVAFYERNGYENRGVADSDHAGETWYNMVKSI